MPKAASHISLVTDLPLQSASENIWDSKYRLRSKDGVIIDQTIDDTYKRVAKALAEIEPKDKERWEQEFLWALRAGAIPAGRILANAGAQEHKPNTSLINCVVSGTIEDSMHGILQKVYEAGMTLAPGCGIGYDFSTLRPRGSFVAGVGAKTSGAISFMTIYDSMCFTVASAGGRRGAQMGTMLITHPSIREFIQAKRQNGMLRQFNLSVLVTEEFMRALENNNDVALWFPHNKKESQEGKEFVYKKWPYHDASMIVADDGMVMCKVYERVPARELWDLIMRSTYDYAEPGCLFIDKVNSENNLWFCEDIRATNPCAEQCLPPYGSCLLGSINLTKFVVYPFSKTARFDFTTFKKVVRTFTRMLDNVVESNGLPLPQQREEIMRKRRHGMGFCGLGSMLTMLGIRYGSKEAAIMAETIAQSLALDGWEEGVELAKEKGPAPIMDETFLTHNMGEERPGRELLAQSAYMQRIAGRNPELIQAIAHHGARFSHHTSIAPTGTMSASVCNNVSNGIEPSFAHRYKRNIIKEGRSTKEQVNVYSYEFLLYCSLANLDPDSDESLKGLPDYFVTTDDLTPEEHIRMQAAVQPWIDSAISKTINVPTDIKFEDFTGIYREAWRQDLKGCATFRFNPEAFSGVLVKAEDLAATKYTFKLANGEEITARGNEQIEYNGEVHVAVNLFDAIKEGYFGRL